MRFLQRPGPKPGPSQPQRQWSESEQFTELQRQLKRAQTRIKNLTETLRTRTAAVTKAEHRTVMKVFYPDTGTHATKRQLDDAFKIVSVKTKVLD